VKFPDAPDNGAIDVVPITWLMDEGKCAWPPRKANLHTAVMSAVPPGEGWPIVNCTILKIYGELTI
jgi:hypothetical protein